MNPLNLLLLFIPVSLALEVFHGPPLFVFISAGLAIIPLAGWMGNATEALAHRMGATWGGLLNATFGNAAELIIAIFAIRAGLIRVVEASITGSIIGNLLLVVGASFLAGGIKYKTQRFNRDLAGMHCALMMMSVVALMVPALFVYTSHGKLGAIQGAVIDPRVESLSLGVAGVLIVIYALSLVFSLITHESLLGGPTREEGKVAAMAPGRALGLLLIATALLAWQSELLVGSVEAVTASLGLTEMFVGVVIVAVIGNAAEHSAAIMFALRNQMDVALNIAVGSSTQIALFVAPLLVFVSLAMGHPMSLIFHPFELVSVAFAATIAVFINLDGRSNWFEGALLLGTYAIIAMAFFFIPG